MLDLENIPNDTLTLDVVLIERMENFEEDLKAKNSWKEVFAGWNINFRGFQQFYYNWKPQLIPSTN